jgi:hypothetical protein
MKWRGLKKSLYRDNRKKFYTEILGKMMFSHERVCKRFWLYHPKTLPAKFPMETRETKLERETYLPSMLSYIRNCVNSVYFLIGGRLKKLTNRWRSLGVSALISKGIMAPYEQPVYINSAHLVQKANEKMRLVKDLNNTSSRPEEIRRNWKGIIRLFEVFYLDSQHREITSHPIKNLYIPG